PDEEHGPYDPALEVLQEHDPVLAVDRVVEVLPVDPTRRRQPDGCGDLAPLAERPEHRRVPLGAPGRPGLDLIGEPRLIDEDDHRTPAAGFFYARPVVLDPGADHLLVALPGPDLGALHRPAQVAELDREVGRMIGHCPTLSDDIPDPGQG